MDIPPQFYKDLVDHLSDGIYFADRDRIIRYWNQSAEALTGYRADEMIGSRCADNLLMHVDAEGHNLCTGRCPLAATIEDGQLREASVYLHHKDGYRVPVDVRVAPIRNSDGAIIGAVETFDRNTQTTELLKRIQTLSSQLLTDELTGIGNRRFANIILDTRLYELGRYGIDFGVLMLDIDHFKAVNDTHGHGVGDRVLHMVAQTISGCLRASDMLFRWGGEEFLAILPNVHEKHLRALAEKVRAITATAFLPLGTARLSVTLSIGATLADVDDTAETLVARADELLYASKAAGRDRVTVDARAAYKV